MDYIEVSIHIKPFRPFNEILVAQLGEYEYESFVEEEKNSLIKAYILEEHFDIKTVEDCCVVFKEALEYEITATKIERVNWNKKWEENFDSVEVGTFCYVRAPFHEAKPDFKHEIIIEPKMSFGTGHHQTTQMMIELMEDIDFKGKKVLDMGSGTGILAILARKMEAGNTDAIDIEDWAFENMKENFGRNEVKVSSYLGGVEVISQINEQYDVIIANINKNILLNQIQTYAAHLKLGGKLLLSGFYKTDAVDLLDADDLKEFSKEDERIKDDWCALKLNKA
ncbi:MAG: 50S ribosomal protein L11 methyltransferase [Flavobacteriales bacterium]|nr:50S ribosomal protein L11 methyltransferase [Flavobacteriales bacterium]